MATHSVQIIDGRKVHKFKFEAFELKEALQARGIDQWSKQVFENACKMPCITYAVNHVKYNRF